MTCTQLFSLIANILDGVMRAAELDSHMGSMKVSVATTANASTNL